MFRFPRLERVAAPKRIIELNGPLPPVEGERDPGNSFRTPCSLAFIWCLRFWYLDELKSPFPAGKSALLKMRSHVRFSCGNPPPRIPPRLAIFFGASPDPLRAREGYTFFSCSLVTAAHRFVRSFLRPRGTGLFREKSMAPQRPPP